MTTTRINLLNEVSGMRDSVEIPLGRQETINRLRAAIGEPVFELDGDDLAVYARVDASPIALHIFGYGREAALAEWNRIVGAMLDGRAFV